MRTTVIMLRSAGNCQAWRGLWCACDSPCWRYRCAQQQQLPQLVPTVHLATQLHAAAERLAATSYDTFTLLCQQQISATNSCRATSSQAAVPVSHIYVSHHILDAPACNTHASNTS